MTDDAPKSFLLDAYMADLLRRPHSPEAERLVDELLGVTLEAESQGDRRRERQRTAQALASLRATIGALTHDLLRAQLNESAQGYCYVSSRDSSRFTSTAASARQYEAVRDIWRDADLIDFYRGLNHGLNFPTFDGEETPPCGRVAKAAAKPLAYVRAPD